MIWMVLTILVLLGCGESPWESKYTQPCKSAVQAACKALPPLEVADCFVVGIEKCRALDVSKEKS